MPHTALPCPEALDEEDEMRLQAYLTSEREEVTDVDLIAELCYHVHANEPKGKKNIKKIKN